jgi:hypothetical protein
MKLLGVVVLFASMAVLKAAQQPTSTPSPSSTPSAQDVPVIDGGLGPCSLELQVNDGNAKPVFAVKVNVHIAYGFMGIKKMDLEAQTNVNGKVRFTGLPAKVHNPPLEFKASKDQLIGLATDNPSAECQAKHDIVLEKPRPAEAATPSPSPTP